MKIRICDDEKESADNWVSEIKAALGDDHDIARVEDVLGAVENLVSRKKTILGEATDSPSEFGDLDGSDVLVIDFDLVHIDDGGARTSGEGVARLVQSYAECGYIVVLNQYQPVIDFDLSLVGHLQSYADKNLNSELIGYTSLWKSDAEAEFNPSYWTNIPDVVAGREKLLGELGDNLDWSLLDFIELAPPDISKIGDTAFAFLSNEAQNIDDLSSVSAKEFLSNILDKDEAHAISSKTPKIANKLVVSRLAKWFDRLILRPLDTVIDVPHLAAKYPFLVEATSDEINSPDFWCDHSRQWEAHLKREMIKDAKLTNAEMLVGREVYSVARIEGLAEFEKLRDEFDYSNFPSIVFAEDISHFIEIADATEFRAGFHNFNDRRFVKNVDGKNYGPLRRFAFGD